MEKMLGSMGAAGWALFPEGTDIEIKESTRGDAYNVFDKRIDRANSELSKGVLTETMTTENGASLSQSEVHLEVLKNIINKDADNLRDVINFQLIPKMIKHGFPLAGYRFDWYEGIDFTPEQQVAYERLLLENYEVDPQYFIDKYNVPIIGKKEPAPVVVPDGKEDKDKDGKQKLARPFFD
uniref:phage portal protein family protein n=1 Tax=Bacteroides cellulosilyticus TaxID=246787 RepID=UPI00374D1BB3